MNLQEEILKIKNEMLDEFDKRVEALKEEEQEFPRFGDEYWYIDDEGDVLNDEWEDFRLEIASLEIGNVFKTQEQADFAVEKLKVEAILRKYSRPFNKDENNYYIEFYLLDKVLSIDCEDYFQLQGTFYFDSEKTALQAIDEAGEWQIKRFIFGMEV